MRGVPGHDSVKGGGAAERRVFALEFVLECEVERQRLAGFVVAQNRLRLAGIMIAVVEEKHDLAADLLLESPRRRDFRVQKSPRKKSAPPVMRGSWGIS